MGMGRRTGPRSFDPVVLGNQEADAWASYYRHEWRRFLVAAVGMVRTGFGMGLVKTVVGAFHVLRANQLWAPYPDNDPVAAEAAMQRFYRLVRDSGRHELEPIQAARHEVAWWDVHRRHQYDASVSYDELVTTLNALYAYVYDAPPELTRRAAALRVDAMDLSDAWVEGGCRLDDPRLAKERRTLVASYAALREAADRRQLRPGRPAGGAAA